MFIFLALMAQSTLVEASQQNPAIAGYLLCAVREAGQFERSGESAESVATTAISACQEMIDYAVESLLIESEAALRTQGYPSLPESQRAGVRAAMRARLQQNAQEMAVARVVEIRAGR